MPRRLLLLLYLACPACIEEQRYAVENEAILLTGDTPAAFVTENDEEVFLVTRPFELQITPPSNSKIAKLIASAQGQNLPFSRLPWVSLHDLELQLDYAIENQSDELVNATIVVDGRNEFHLYTPGPEDFHQWERRVTLEPHERMHGLITELEMDELAVDLATVVNGAPNSNQVVFSGSQSGQDERVQPFIPKVIPGLVGLNIGILAEAARPLRLEVSVRMQDHEGRAAKRGERRWQLPDPEPFVPVVLEADE